MNNLKSLLKPFLHLKFFISYLLAYFITNAWSYVGLGIGIAFKITWLTSLCSAYVAFLYLPFTMEKIVTIPLAIFFQTKLFPKDEKLHQELTEMYRIVKREFHEMKAMLKWKKWRKWII